VTLMFELTSNLALPNGIFLLSRGFLYIGKFAGGTGLPSRAECA
jgi:hypothetical protein